MKSRELEERGAGSPAAWQCHDGITAISQVPLPRCPVPGGAGGAQLGAEESTGPCKASALREGRGREGREAVSHGLQEGQLTCWHSQSPAPAHPGCGIPQGWLCAPPGPQTQLGLAFYILWKRVLLENLSPIIFSEPSSAFLEALQYLLSCLSCRWIFVAQFGNVLISSQLVPPPPHLN